MSKCSEECKLALYWRVTRHLTCPMGRCRPWVGLNGSGAGGTLRRQISPRRSVLPPLTLKWSDDCHFDKAFPNRADFGIWPPMASWNGLGWRQSLDLASFGQVIARCYSLGLTTTCISSNDWTARRHVDYRTALQSSVASSIPQASQNYVNNTVNAGAPIQACFALAWSTNGTTPLGPPS
jgi:hypothetical protein